MVVEEESPSSGSKFEVMFLDPNPIVNIPTSLEPVTCFTTSDGVSPSIRRDIFLLLSFFTRSHQ